MGQDVNTPEVSKNRCLTQDWEWNLITRENWNVRGVLQQNVSVIPLATCNYFLKSPNPNYIHVHRWYSFLQSTTSHILNSRPFINYWLRVERSVEFLSETQRALQNYYHHWEFGKCLSKYSAIDTIHTELQSEFPA